MRLLGDCVCPDCGGLYWRKAAWQHKCVVANKPELVANVTVTKVANKHGVYKNKEARLEYMRELMRKRRAEKILKISGESHG
jgi:hypothetical protein